MYVPKSTNPYVTSAMLKNALWQVHLDKAPKETEDSIGNQTVFRLVIDDSRRKLLALDFNDKIILSLDFIDIETVFCVEKGEPQAYRYRIAVLMKSGEEYIFYVNSPFNKYIMSFINMLTAQINYARKYFENPNFEKLENEITPVLLICSGIVIAMCVVDNWMNRGNIGWDILAVFFALICIVGGIITMYHRRG